MKKLIAAMALGTALTSAPVLAQAAQPQAPGAAQRGGGFMQRDQTRAEAQQRADMMFQMLDANKDGSVTKAEAEQALAQFQAARGGADQGSRGAGRLQRMLDGAFGAAQSLTKQQFEAQALARFDASDVNHDGTVTSSERQQLRAQGSGQPTAPASTPQ